MTNPTSPRSRRRHSPEFKAELVALARQPGSNPNRVAQDHDIHPSLLRSWLKHAAAAPVAPLRLVPVQLDTSSVPATIQLQLQRGRTRVQIAWPETSAQVCAQWLGRWLA